MLVGITPLADDEILVQILVQIMVQIMVQILVQLLVQILVQILYKSWYKFSQSEENNILWGVHIFVTFWNVFPADYKCRNCCLTAWLKINCVQNARRAHMFRVVDVDGDGYAHLFY